MLQGTSKVIARQLTLSIQFMMGSLGSIFPHSAVAMMFDK